MPVEEVPVIKVPKMWQVSVLTLFILVTATASFKVDAMCDPSCKNDGMCSVSYTCSCTPEWTGDTCETPICDPSCKNGGTCSAPGTCTCTPGWTGVSCETPICDPSCKNDGTCHVTYSCSCTPEWTGDTCETPICDPSCKNGGTCSAPGTCTCTPEWTGVTCETQNPSTMKPSTLMARLMESDPHNVTQETDELGELVESEEEELEGFPEGLVDVSDTLTIDGRTCFTAWDKLKGVEQETLLVMTKNPKTHPCKPVGVTIPSSGYITTDTGVKPWNYSAVKTPCYRSLDPRNATEAEAGYCDCRQYTRWEGQRFCCPQCCVLPQLTGSGNMFKCTCVFDAYITALSR